MQSKQRLVYGIGINDSDYQVTINYMIDGRRYQLWRCPLYLSWKNMLERCYSAKLHANCPAYIGCSVVPEWHRFSVFREWILTQDWEGKDLDKDILISGNKVYGPQSCIFISSQLNKFMTDSGTSRGEWPIGVIWQKDHGKFRAKCRSPFTGIQEHIGYFDCPNAAHEAWRARKHQHACRYADTQTDPRISNALRTRYAFGEPNDHHHLESNPCKTPMR